MVGVVNQKMVMYAGLGIAVALVLNKITNGDMGREGGAAVARGLLDVAAGGVLGVGDAIGLPRTDTPESQDKCMRAMAEGSIGEASLYCAAPVFVKWIMSGSPSGGATGSW